jgi:RNA polymerase sigma factor (sigma-70 family)
MEQKDIVASIRNGEELALKMLYRQHKGSVTRYLISKGCNEEEAKDIFQDAVIVFYEKAKQSDFVLTSSISTYLSAVSRNIFLKKMRSKGIEISSDFDNNEAIEPIEEDEELLSNDRVAAILHVLKEMVGNCKTLLEAFYYEKKSIKEIQTVFGYNNEDTAKNQKYKCLKRLKQLVTDKYPNLQ